MVELIWDGKYDTNGKQTAPPRLKLPFQTVETINESAQQRQMSLDLFSAGRPSEWRNRLIWGDKKYVLPALLDEFGGKVNLIYIDPPFNVGADFSYIATIPDNPEAQDNDEETSFYKAPSIIEQKAYRDTWGRGLASYLQWFYETVVLLRDLLTDNGAIYVHLDQHMIDYVKIVMDEVMGPESFLNHIIWSYRRWPSNSMNYQTMHDDILFYVKNPSVNRVFNIEYEDPSDSYLKRFKGKTQILDPETKTRKIVVDEPTKGMPLRDVWDLSIVAGFKAERTGYPTQKPESLLERIIKTSTKDGDLVLDCFCGSGTTAAVAEKLNRRWITCDLGRFAIHTARKRLLSIPNVKPFAVQNLGKYERQAWQTAEFGGEKKATVMVNQYRCFILDLYNARPIEGYTWLHGIRDGRMVHVGPVDSPISPNDVTQIAIEFKKAKGTGKDAPSIAAVDVLGWDFAFELNEIATQQAAQAGITVKFMRIPREVLESKAVEQGDIKFFELAALSVDVHKKKKEVTLTLKDFVIPPDDVPADVQKAITHWSQWIDYWAVDWDNKDDTFHNMWQTYRTRQDKTLMLKGSHIYEEAGEYTIMVKVIDILGNDTTKAVKVKVS
jgi:adenine-specific DNA-methyltransferase